MIYDINDYEKELRKLVRCEDEPDHPITPYGRERKRIYELLKVQCSVLSSGCSPYVAGVRPNYFRPAQP